MHFNEMVIVLVAMGLGYSIIKHLFAPGVFGATKELKFQEKIRKRRRKQMAKDFYFEDPQVSNLINDTELRERADDLLRRMKTLEEIVSADVSMKRS